MSDNNKLKKIIKEYVREALLEVFAEMKLENIVENVVERRREANNDSSFFRTREQEMPKKNTTDKKALLEKMGITDTTWKAMYEDTLSSGSPVVSGEQSANSIEHVSENVMENMGLFNKDFSKFLNDKPSKDDADAEEWAQRRAQREKILKETLKR